MIIILLHETRIHNLQDLALSFFYFGLMLYKAKALSHKLFELVSSFSRLKSKDVSADTL